MGEVCTALWPPHGTLTAWRALGGPAPDDPKASIGGTCGPAVTSGWDDSSTRPIAQFVDQGQEPAGDDEMICNEMLSRGIPVEGTGDRHLTATVEVWDVDHVMAWIDRIVASMPYHAPSNVALDRFKRLAVEIRDMVDRYLLSGLRSPQVDIDPEGGLDFVWAQERAKRYLSLTIDVNRPEGHDVDVMLVDGDDGYDLEGASKEQLRSAFMWYQSAGHVSWRDWLNA